MLRGDNKMIPDDKPWQNFFNEHYINIVGRSNGFKPEKIACHNEELDKRIVLYKIIKQHENHSSIIRIKNDMSVKSYLSSNNTLASAKQVTSSEANLILKLPKKRLVRIKYRRNL